jgi:phage gp36-like protein
MPYATAEDMLARFGEVEMTRLTAAEGELDAGVVAAKVETALREATGLIDSYLRRRYAVPLAAPVPPEIVRACCVLARYDLAHGEQREPSEQMRLARREVVEWLAALADGKAVLDGAVPAAGASGAGAMASDRARAFSPESLRGW